MDITLEDLVGRIEFEANYNLSERVKNELLSLWEWGIERISDDNIRGAVKCYFFCKVPYQFFTAPSSTSGKHPYWHNVPGGLVRHLTECCISADRLISMCGFVEEDDLTVNVFARDIVLAATVITDTQKNGIPWGGSSVISHGEIAANVWRDVAEACKISADIIDQIAEAVHFHYGRFTQVPGGHLRKRINDFPDFVKIVHLLDACSSNSDNELIYRPVDRILSPLEVLDKRKNK